MVWYCDGTRSETLADMKLRGSFTGWAIDDLDIYWHRKSYTFYLADGDTVAAYLWLRKLAPKVYTVRMVEADRRYKNVIVPLYVWLVSHKGWTIKAGDVENIQTPGGRYLWNELAKQPDINVLACKNARAGLFVNCFPGEREPVAYEFDLYESDAEIYLTA